MARIVIPEIQVRSTVYDTVIEQWFQPGGDVWKQTRELGVDHMRFAKIKAPKRTGQLARSHNLRLTPFGKLHVRYHLGNYAPYAAAVALGTDGPIRSDKWTPRNKWLGPKGQPLRTFIRRQRRITGFMVLRRAPSSWYPERWVRQFVKGQDANDWIYSAFLTARRSWGQTRRFR